MTNHIPRLSLGWRLRMAMEHAKISRARMAVEMEVSVATITRWTHDDWTKRPPRTRDLRAWAELCDVDLHWLLTGEGTPDPDEHEQYADDRLSRLDRDASPVNHQNGPETNRTPDT